MLNPDRVASKPGAFHVSEANFRHETREDLHFPDSLRILDSTLRKTFFTAGHVTSPAGFVRIAEALVELGVTDTCLNVTWAGDETPTPQDWALMSTILDADLPLRVNVWSDVLLGNGRDPLPIDPLDGLRRLVDAGARCIAPGIVPAPDADAAARQMEGLDAHLDLARELGVTTTITLAQVGLRDFDELVRVSAHAVRGGAARLDLMDSTSSMSPEAMKGFVRRFRAAIPAGAEVTMHVHDEFGLATAGALAAASEGAAPDVSANGMSYRAGFAALEEVVLALEVLYGVDTGLRLDRLAHLCRVVAAESGIPVPPLKPLSGGYAHLKHMPGDATAAIEKGGAAFPPISHGIVPAVMGGDVEWVWGISSSNAQVRALAVSEGIHLAESEIAPVRGAIDAAVAAREEYPRWLRPQEASSVLHRAVRSLREGIELPAAGDVVDSAVPDAEVAASITERLGGDRYQEVPDDEAVRAAVVTVVTGLSTGRLIDLLAGFNRFGETGGARPELSAHEEARLARSARHAQEELHLAAEEYERRFGWRAVFAAEGRSAEHLAAEIAATLEHDAQTELRRARAAVAEILARRIVRSEVNPG